MEAMTGWKPRTETTATNKAKLRGRSSLNMAISFAKIFLCSPISHNEVFWVGVRPRRRGSNGALPRSRSSAESCKRTWEGRGSSGKVARRRCDDEEVCRGGGGSDDAEDEEKPDGVRQGEVRRKEKDWTEPSKENGHGRARLK
ncbi:hypothetical protein HPP92_007366 [Vanilla planifolia]|uniref:Uncharacterized protein n=1 Tax=Vanilla planifolia TaxID=51239 RepID=A0A835RQQ7_VANPL|nr:hypothetical protein HPP92_007366 [Vanilla planifolia]